MSLDNDTGTISITRNGATAKMFWGSTPPYDIPIGTITHAHLQKATISTPGYVSLGINGSAPFAGRVDVAAFKMPTVVTFVRRQQGAFERLHEQLSTLISSGSFAGVVGENVEGGEPPHQARGYASRLLKTASGTNALDRIVQDALFQADAAIDSGIEQFTLSIDQADIGVRNTFDQAVSYIVKSLQSAGLSVSAVHGTGWDRTRLIVAGLPVAFEAQSEDISTQLERLAGMRNGGQLSEEEFRIAKARILGL